MKIKLAIVDNDANYAKRLISNLQINYADKIEPRFFSSYDLFEKYYQDNRVQVVLVSEELEVCKEQIPEDVSFAWLVADNTVKMLEGHSAVGKFQKVELLYKSVLGLYADMESRRVFRGGMRKDCVTFTSAQGGAGTSSVAAAYALYLAKKGKRPLYLSLDRLSRSDFFLHGEGSFGFSEILYAIKAQKGNLALKAESIMERDDRGVLFFAPCKYAGDMLEMKVEDVEAFFTALNTIDSFDVLVVDLPMDFSDICSAVMNKYASSIFVISDGSRMGNVKFERAVEILRVRGGKNEDLLMKAKLLYNRSDRGNKTKISEPIIEVAGELNFVDAQSQEEVIERLSVHPAFNQIL